MYGTESFGYNRREEEKQITSGIFNLNRSGKELKARFERQRRQTERSEREDEEQVRVVTFRTTNVKESFGSHDLIEELEILPRKEPGHRELKFLPLVAPTRLGVDQ